MQNVNKTLKSELIQLISDESNEKVITEIVQQIKRTGVSKLSEQELKKLYIKLLASKLSFSINNIIHTITDEKIRELLSKANQEQDVSIKLFKGISLDSKYIPEREKRNNFTGEIMIYPPYIKPKVTFSKDYIRGLYNHYY